MNLIGQTFGRLTVKKFMGPIGAYLYGWRCVCECGESLTVRQDSLRNETTKSCGCLFKEYVAAHVPENKTHGEGSIKTKEYAAWSRMRQRCYNPNNHKFQDYGARHITVCRRWLKSYENFLKDMGRAPSLEHSLDRKNNNGNYTLSNCRWATAKQQANNRRPRRCSA